jgi:hypothetical protein
MSELLAQFRNAVIVCLIVGGAVGLQFMVSLYKG